MRLSTFQINGYHGYTPGPYTFNFTLINKLDEIRWVNVSADYYEVELYQNDEYILDIISVNDPEAQLWGLGFASKGRHSVIHWRRLYPITGFPDAEYELRAIFRVGGEEYQISDIYFTVETKRVPAGTVY